MKKYFLTLYLLLSIQICISAQTFFRHTYGVGSHNDAYSLKQTTDEGFVIAGSCDLFGNTDFSLYKVDSIGNFQWHKPYGDNANQVAMDVQIMSDGGYLLTGFGSDFPSGDFNGWVVRTDVNGDTLWTKKYGGSEWDFLDQAIVLPSGNIYFCGYSFSNNGLNSDVWLILTDGNGNILNEKFVGSSNNEKAKSFIIDVNGNLMIVGETEAAVNFTQAMVMVCSPNLDSLSSVYFPTPQSATLADVDQSSDGKIILGGSQVEANGKLRAWVFQTDNLFNILHFDYTVFYDNNEYVTDIKYSPDGRIVIGITTDTIGWARNDYLLWIFDHDFFYQQGITFGYNDDEYLKQTITTSDGGYAQVGITESYGPGYEAVYLVKTDSILQVGTVAIGLDEFSEDNFLLYPNPAQDQVYFSKSLSIKQAVIFDVNGKAVYHVRDRMLHAINISDFSDGIYFLKIDLNDGSAISKKFIKAQTH